MPRAFLIKAKTRAAAQKKDKSFLEDEPANINAQSVEFSGKQDSPVAHLVSRTSPPVQVTVEAERKFDPRARRAYYSPQTDVIKTSRESHSQRLVSSTVKSEAEPDNRAEYISRENKRAYEEEFIDDPAHKKLRKGLPKKSVVHYYRTENGEREEIKAVEANIVRNNPELRHVAQHYTHDVLHYPNERVNYGQHHQVPQSRETSNGSGYSRASAGSFAIQNGRESLERGKTNFSRRIDANNNSIERGEGLDSVKIVEYHSIELPRRDVSKERTALAQQQRPRQGYYIHPRETAVSSVQHVPAPAVSTAPAPPPQNPPHKPDSDAKVVYVPVYAVAQGPNGVIYEPIPNATPIMAKDAVKIEPAQMQLSPPPQPSPQQLSPPPVPMSRPQPTQPLPSPRPPMQHAAQPGLPSRGYEPPQPQQLAASPAPQPYQPPPQSQVAVHQQPPYPVYSVAGAPSSTYPGSRPPMPHPQYHPAAQSHPVRPPQSPHQAPQHPPASVVRVPVTSVQQHPITHTHVPTSQAYQGVPQPYNGQYEQRQHAVVSHQRYQRPSSPPITVSAAAQRTPQPQPVRYQHPEGRYVAQASTPNPQRPPPLPSQPLHAEKPSLPSPSYPQEGSTRMLTPQHTPSSAGREQKFVYAPPPANFMNSPVYRVPTGDDADTREAHYHANKIGSRKRKSSNPVHAVPHAQRHTASVPSPPDSYTAEADLRCNESLVRSTHQGSPLNRSSLVMTPPGSPEDENGEMVTVVLRDQGIQASPHDPNRPPIQHYGRNHSLHSESSEEGEDLDIEKDDDDDDDPDSWPSSPTEKENMYTEDGTLVVHIPGQPHRKLKGRRGNVRFTCRYCNKGFQWHSHLASHERTHTGEKPFKCPECKRAFCRADGLQCHMLVHNKKKLFKCHYCGKGFNDKIILEKHIYSHTGVKPFKCEYCGRAFSDSLSIEKHLLVHTGTKPYKCQYCVRSFNDSQMLVRHIRSHTGEKPFKCKHCPMAFSKQSALIIHTRVHTGEKPYQCPHCTKSFSISGNLQRHILIHTGERPYKCSKCPKAFNNPSHLSRHISKLHAPQPLNNAKIEQNSYQVAQEPNTDMYKQVQVAN